MSKVLKGNINYIDLLNVKEKDFKVDIFEKDNENTDDITKRPEDFKRIGLMDEKSFPASSVEMSKLLTLDTPIPVPELPDNTLSIDLICEKPVNYPVVNGSIFYPLGDSTTGYDFHDFMIDSDGYIPMTRSDSYLAESGKLYSHDDYQDTSFSKYLCSSYDGMFSTTNKVKNLLKYPYPNDQKWTSYWDGYSNAKFFTPNIFNAEDGLIIYPDATTNIIFNLPYTIKKDVDAGYYCFSFFIRLDDSDNTKGYKSSLINISTSSSNFILVCSDTIKESDTSINIDTNWHKVSMIVQLSEGKNYFELLWLGSSKRELPLKICGLCLTKTSYPIPYDHRFIDYKNIDYKNKEQDLKQCPLAIEFPSLSEAWTIIYKRNFFTKYVKGSTTVYCDCLGSNLKFGYKGNDAFISYKENEQRIPNIADNYFREPETVMLQFSNKKITYSVYTIKGSYSIDDIEIDDDTFTGVLGGLNYNILLGGMIENNEFISNCGCYRDLIMIPRGLTPEEQKKVFSDIFAVAKGLLYTAVKTGKDIYNPKTKAKYEYYEDALSKNYEISVGTKYDPKPGESKEITILKGALFREGTK